MERIFRDGADGRHAHDGQNKGRVEQVQTGSRPKVVLQKGSDHDHAEKAENHGGQGRQQFHKGLDDTARRRGRKLVEIHGGHDAQRDGQQGRKRRYGQRGDKQRENAEQAGIFGGIPQHAAQKIQRGMRAEQGQAFQKEKKHNACQRQQGAAGHGCQQVADTVFFAQSHAAVLG